MRATATAHCQLFHLATALVQMIQFCVSAALRLTAAVCLCDVTLFSHHNAIVHSGLLGCDTDSVGPQSDVTQDRTFHLPENV